MRRHHDNLHPVGGLDAALAFGLDVIIFKQSGKRCSVGKRKCNSSSRETSLVHDFEARQERQIWTQTLHTKQ